MTNDYKSNRVTFGKPAQQKTFQTSRTEIPPLLPEMGLKGLSRPSWPLTLALTTAMFFMGTMYIEENGTLPRNVEENSQIMNMEQRCHCEIHHPIVNKPCPTSPPTVPKAEPTEIKLDENTEMQENTKDAEEKAALKKEEEDLCVTEINLTGKRIPNI